MADMVQNVLAVSLCLAAASYVAWCAWRAVSSHKAGCGTCGSCSTSSPPEAAGRKTLLTIDSPDRT
jgi:hypothetical protein